MKYLYILLLALTLSACGATKPISQPITKPVNIDSYLLTYCDLLDESLAVNSFEASLEAYANLASKYSSCVGKQAAGVKLIKELGNIK